MKNMLLIVSIFALAACSSAPKEEAPVAEPVDNSTPAPEPAPAEPVQDTMSMDKGANMEGGFPDVEGTERSGATCKNGGDERMISVIDTREGPCGVVYTKHGNKKTVAYAKFEMPFCDKVFDNIVGNLTNGGFDCGGAGSSAAAAPAEEPKAEEQPAEQSAEEQKAEGQ